MSCSTLATAIVVDAGAGCDARGSEGGDTAGGGGGGRSMGSEGNVASSVAGSIAADTGGAVTAGAAGTSLLIVLGAVLVPAVFIQFRHTLGLKIKFQNNDIIHLDQNMRDRQQSA